MKKSTTPKEPMKRESETSKRPVCLLLMLNLVLWIPAVTGIGLLIKYADETNRLLSTFQRTDTVKSDCDEGFVDIDGKCYAKIGAARNMRIYKNGTIETNDPNLCKQWKTICNDGPVGPQCDVTCNLPEDDE